MANKKKFPSAVENERIILRNSSWKCSTNVSIISGNIQIISSDYLEKKNAEFN
jgi:hypothetical protein